MARRRIPPTDAEIAAASGTMDVMDTSSRRKFVVGGLAFLAACSSSGVAADNQITLGPDDSTDPVSEDPVSEDPVPEETVLEETVLEDPVPEPGATPTPDPERPPAIDREISFDYLDGTPGTLADFDGMPLVVNFFASWCPPCRAEMPDFQEVFKKYEGQVQFLGFSVSDPIETTRELLVETGVTYPIAMDPDQQIQFAFKGIAMPTTILIDRHGGLAAGRAGAITGADLEALIVEELL